ncbi:hypothetical protein RA27_07435 [Ruegeria sp. ANG-R]|uniref:hypothetical protein n=1 Tax=Ruegeria sp. ANG-R TaxID=1577903 RepID=UPI00057EFBFE|nr:hypothetical protein [Ruegeria sp. ANG-R]KIC43132.1 hypothetical protein RA27_07435 [Ruegeria sp. ANG-R]
MSDRVVNANIQDVLSSVKRMVDEDAHDESEFIFVPSAPAPKPGRLVLTDALRVSDEPLIAKKPAPLKLMPQHTTREGISKQAANEPSNPAEPMRLQPSDIVRAGNPKAETPKRDLAGSLSAKIEALEAAIARTEDQWEPDGESDDAYSGTKTQAVEWPVEKGFAQSQTAEPEAEAGPEATFIRDPAVVAEQEQKPADVTIGEAELRELVAQIVREELQGALGERITRNLRKMVRREITRAIAASDID